MVRREREGGRERASMQPSTILKAHLFALIAGGSLAANVAIRHSICSLSLKAIYFV